MSVNNFDIKQAINGDTVIGFTSVEKMQLNGMIDSPRVATYLMDDAGQAHKKHLGLINLMATTHKVNLPFMRDLFKDSAVLEVEPGQAITYDLPVDRTEPMCQTAEDTSDERDYPGMDGTVFPIVLTQEFTKGDILTYDPIYGDQVHVSNAHEVEQVGENYRHWVILGTKDKTKWFPKDKLKAGIAYMKIGHIIGEYETDASTITMQRNPSGTITCEYLLGDPRMVETMYTDRASRMSSPGLSTFSSQMRDDIQKQLEMMGGKASSMMYTGKLGQGGKGIIPSSVKIGTTLEYLAMMELARMESYSLLFAKAATIRTATGTKSINEGVWHQLRRGKLIKYSRPGGITFNQIHEAASYIYKNSNISVMDRVIKFRVGSMAWANLMLLFRSEVVQQLTGLPTNLLGGDATIKGVFSGDLQNLHMNAVRFTSVMVPGIGKIEAELDETLDYQPLADRRSAQFFGQGYAHTSYSMVIWDATKPEYTNVNTKVKGANLVEDGSKTANIYYIKPEGAHVVYGYEQGRMANQGQTEYVQSSLKNMGRTFWATSTSGALVLDTTRFVIIELQL
jgi:hypothetical protein